MPPFLLAGFLGFWSFPHIVPAQGPSGIVQLTSDTLNLTMLLFGLLLHGWPMRCARAIEAAASGCVGVLLRLRPYAGIVGILRVSGLRTELSSWCTAGASETLLPLASFVSAAVVHFFVPSGGGRWAIPVPIALCAVSDAGVPASKVVLSIALGAQLTNMLQLFWALLLLGVAPSGGDGRARDIVRYSAWLMVAGWALLCLCPLLI